MQQATHPRLHLRDSHDAHTVFEGVRRGLLPAVTRRLNEIERAMHIRSGAVFVWEECQDETGLKRWTDGRIWSQSRMREPYLFYEEQTPDAPRTRSQGYTFVDGPTRPSHYDRAAAGERSPGLIKQAYSAWVKKTSGEEPRKWHLTAYFTYSDLESMPTVDQDSLLSVISQNVPAGVFKCAKSRSRNDREVALEVPRPPSRQIYTLPSLQTTTAFPTRMAEDQRLIHMLNVRHNR